MRDIHQAPAAALSRPVHHFLFLSLHLSYSVSSVSYKQPRTTLTPRITPSLYHLITHNPLNSDLLLPKKKKFKKNALRELLRCYGDA